MLVAALTPLPAGLTRSMHTVRRLEYGRLTRSGPMVSVRWLAPERPFTDNASDIKGTVRAFCVSDTSSKTPVVLNCHHESDRDVDGEARQSSLGHLLH